MELVIIVRCDVFCLAVSEVNNVPRQLI